MRKESRSVGEGSLSPNGESTRLASLWRGLRGKLNWCIKISAPDDPTALRWGDTAFAADLAEALTRLGQTVRIEHLGATNSAHLHDDVVVVLRGLHRIPPAEGSVNYLWIISHPDAVSDDEALTGWTRVYAASRVWRRAGSLGALPLLQASSATRFAPGAAHADLSEDVLFVGTSRGLPRPVIRDALETGADVGIYGHDWDDFVHPSAIRADHLEFARVPDAYRSARIILNDHWADMRDQGFISNRLFDATFVGARVISDQIDGLDEIFGGLVQTYRTRDQLVRLLNEPEAWPDRQERLQIAAQVRRRESFDNRARTLIDTAKSDVLRHLRTRRGASPT